MLQRGDQVSHFAVTTVAGNRFDYAEVWQRRNLVLVCLPSKRPVKLFRDYAAELAARVREVADDDTDCVITSDSIPGIPAPGVLVADRWGEIYFIAASRSAEDLPDLDQVLEWLRYVQHECPECQGEAR